MAAPRWIPKGPAPSHGRMTSACTSLDEANRERVQERADDARGSTVIRALRRRSGFMRRTYTRLRRGSSRQLPCVWHLARDAARWMEAAGLAALPFVIAGSLKIAYDLLLYRSFRAHRPPEEQTSGAERD